jgi:hypothetical protein
MEAGAVVLQTTPAWQLFFSTLGGTLVGFFLALSTTAYRERPKLKVALREPKERVYVTANKRPTGKNSYTVMSPEDAREVVLTTELVVVNASAAYDAVNDVWLEITVDGKPTHVPARERADSTFGGLNIPPRQAISHRVRFFLPKTPAEDRNNLSMAAPPWLFTDQFHPMKIHWSSVRSHLWEPRRPISGSLNLDTDWGEPLHEVGMEIWYLHRPPPA